MDLQCFRGYGVWRLVREKFPFALPSPLFLASHDALCHHGASHLHETGDVGAFHIVDVAIGLAVLQSLGVNVAHDLVELSIHFFGGP